MGKIGNGRNLYTIVFQHESMAEKYNRRRFVKGMSAVGAVSIAGCADQDDDGSDGPVEDQVLGEDEADEFEPVPEIEYTSLSRGYNPQLYDEGTMLRQGLQSLGFRLEERTLEASAFWEEWEAHELDMYHLWWHGSVEQQMPLRNFYRSYHSDNIGETNFSGFSSEEYDEAVDEFATMVDDPEGAQERADFIQEILALNQPVIFTIVPNSMGSYNNEFYDGFEPQPGVLPLGNMASISGTESSRDDDTFVWGQIPGFDFFPNPMHNNNDTDRELRRFWYDTLISLDTEANIVPRLAEDWEYIEPDVLQFQLRENLQWHDGVELTAEDVAFTFDYIDEHGYPDLAADMEPYSGSEVIDDRTVNLELTNPSIGFLPSACPKVLPLPKHIWDGVVDEEGLQHPSDWQDPDLTGAGPFEFDTYDPGQRLILEKFDDHYMSEQFDFDRLVFDQYGTNATLVNDVNSGEVSVGQFYGPEDYNRAQDFESSTAVSGPSFETHALNLSTEMVPFNDVLVRQSLAYAIDDQQLIDAVYQGAAESTSTVVPPASPWYNPDVPMYEHDLERARELLVEAGFRYSEEGELLMPIDWEPTVTYISPDE